MKKIYLLAALMILTACSSPEPAPEQPTETFTQPTAAEIAEQATEEPKTEPTIEPTISPIELALPIKDSTAPTIDGRFSTGEWDEALQTELSDGRLVYWLYTNGHLFVGIEESAVGAANLAFIRQPGELWILHASAALGSLIYEQEGEIWTKVQDWNWCCRSFTDSSPIDALYDAEGWRSKITSSGVPGSVEFMVKLDPGKYQTAIEFIFADNSGNFAWWPAALSATAIGELRGPFPEEIAFSLNEWVTIIIGE